MGSRARNQQTPPSAGTLSRRPVISTPEPGGPPTQTDGSRTTEPRRAVFVDPRACIKAAILTTAGIGIEPAASVELAQFYQSTEGTPVRPDSDYPSTELRPELFRSSGPCSIPRRLGIDLGHGETRQPRRRPVVAAGGGGRTGAAPFFVGTFWRRLAADIPVRQPASAPARLARRNRASGAARSPARGDLSLEADIGHASHSS